MNQVQIATRAFVEHVGIKALWTQQTDTRNQMLALGDKLRQLGLKPLHIMLDARATHKPKFAIQGMKPEIGQRGQGEGRNNEVAQE